MARSVTTGKAKRWTAGELLKLPARRRNAILRAAAKKAEAEYRENADLTAFEAFGKDDLKNGESESAQARSKERRSP